MSVCVFSEAHSLWSEKNDDAFPILKITFCLSLCLPLGLSAWGQQSHSAAPGAGTAAQREKHQVHDSGQASRFEFDRPPERVTFRNGDVQLTGVLVKPDGVGPFPAVILVHGSGPATHDEPAFVVHANSFLRQGFASFPMTSAAQENRLEIWKSQIMTI